jgi:hypothetical protein
LQREVKSATGKAAWRRGTDINMRMAGYAVLVILATLLAGGAGDALGQTSDRFPINLDGKKGLIDGLGKIVIPPKYAEVRQFHEGVAAVLRDTKWGYVDAAGTEVVTPSYREAGDFSEGISLVMDGNGRTGYIDHQWQMKTLDCIPLSPATDILFAKIPPPFSEGLTEVESAHETAYIDRTCNKVITQPGVGNGFSEGLAAVCAEDKCGYIDHTGKIAIPLKFSFAGRFAEGLALVEIASGWGYIDRSGKTVIQPQFGNGSRAFSEGLAAVQIDKLMGYIDKSGRIVVPAKYNLAYDFSEGLAQVQHPLITKVVGGREENVGGLDIVFINHAGIQAITSSFDPTFAEGFAGGLADVMIHGREAYINHQGVTVWIH